MNLIVKILLQGLFVIVISYLFSGIYCDSFLAALIAAIFLIIGNNIIRPLLVLLTLPITILTLGLFLLIINGLIVLLVDFFVPGFAVANLLWAIIFSLTLSVFNFFFIRED